MRLRLLGEGMMCPSCDGSGEGPCANCGDDPQECACDEQELTDCDQCDGTGEIEPPRKLTQQEQLEGLADRGCDTLADFEDEK